jgi:hypothetical protein
MPQDAFLPAFARLLFSFAGEMPVAAVSITWSKAAGVLRVSFETTASKSQEDHQAAARARNMSSARGIRGFVRALRGELMRTLRSEISAVGAVMPAVLCLLAATGCAGDAGANAVHAGANATFTGEKIVLERGHSTQNQPWRLTANEQRGQLGLYLESPSGRGYSGGVGFAAGPAAGFWAQGLGRAGSDFFYGPVPASAVMVRLTAPGRAPVLVRTRPFPLRAGLPHGRFFITQPPGSASVNWNVTPLDASGHKIAFTDF